MTSLAERAAKMSPHGREVLARELIRAGTVFPIHEVAEPVAVVGMGCRLPGDVDGPESFWQLLVNGGDGISEVPADRWDVDEYYDPDPEAPDRMTTKWGGFVSDVAGFDADFFGIAPREAAAMDPQQRLLLEVTWEALENAGITPDALSGTRTGVMMGLGSWDYTVVSMERRAAIDAYMGTGVSHSTAVGRISYLLGLRGPAVAVDTACSSSLVALHLACQSLRLRESDLALAGGVQLTLSPFTSVMLSKLSALSPRGRCSTFDAGADGFVRGEGAGVVVLKRLSDAVRDGDRVLAVVRGSAVNQDGRTNGLTAPNLVAQRDVITDALRAGAVAADSVNYVEAHGTGTVLGDPIEFEALAATYGRGDVPCALGAVKTNLGHLEAAAGIAGLIKAVLVLERGQIPPNLHFTRWNPAIDASATRLFVPTEATAWPDSAEGPRRAAVSSFGISGTNAHVVLEQAPDSVSVVDAPQAAVTTLVISGKGEARIASTAGMLADWMDGVGAQVTPADVAHTVNHHRARDRKFATVCARDRGQTVAGLRALAAGVPASGVVSAHEGICRAGTVFVYSGQGSHWAGMARQLLSDEPVFAAAVDELEPVFVEQVGFSLRQVLVEGERVAGDARVQPVLVGLQLALTELWRSYGVTPDAVIGHSVGEVSAAVVAGALTVTEGLRVVATRSRLMARLAGQGAVGLLELDAEATEELIADYPGVELAVHSSPRQTVIAGPVEAVDELIAVVQQQHRFARRVNMEVASHTALMDPILDELAAELADLAPKKPAIRFISTVVEDQQVLDAGYWVANVRRPVRLRQAIMAAGADNGMFVEVSPHPQLTHAISENLTDVHHHSVGTLTRDGDDTVSFHTSLNATHTVEPPQFPHPPEPHPVLPATPWHHTHHWVAGTSALDLMAHPLLGVGGVMDPTSGARVWERTLGPDVLWLGDHHVDGECALPAGVYAELVLAAVTDAYGSDRPWMIRELCLDEPMPLAGETVVVTRCSGEQAGPRVEVRSRGADGEWTLHATATVERAAGPVPEPLDFDAVSASALDPSEFFGRLADAGRELGPALRGIVGLSVTQSGGVRAEVRLPSPAKQDSRRMLLHPVMVEAALQALGASTVIQCGADSAVVPVRIGRVRSYGDVTTAVGAVGVVEAGSAADRFVGRVMLTGPDGRVLADLDGVDLVVRAPAARHELDGQLFGLAWEPVQLNRPAGQVGAVLLVGDHVDGDEVLGALAPGLSGHGGRVELVSAADEVGLRTALTRKDVSFDAIVVLCPPRGADEARPEVEQLGLAQSRTLLVAGIVKTLSHVGTRNSPRLWLVTRGAAQAGDSDGVSLAQTPLRGIARVLTFEHPELKTTVVDIDAEGAGSVDGLVAELCAGADHDEVALRDGLRFVNRLVGVPVPDPAPASRPLVRGDGGYIVVGGMGGLGLVMARWLAEQGAGMVVVNGRSAPTAEVEAAIAEMSAAGTRIEVVTGDISEPGTAARLVAAVQDAGLRPAGVLHSAMVLADEVVYKMSAEAIARVFSPKVAGGWWLHRATEHLDLDWWLAFSSSASMHGSPGQGAYAAANSWVDALIAYRRSHGLAATGINWGPWAEVGRGQFFAERGFEMITPQLGLSAMELMLASGRAQTGVFRIDARQWFQYFPAVAGSSLFESLGQSAKMDRRRGDGQLRADLDAAQPAQRPVLLATALATEIQAVRRSSDPLAHDQPMDSLGLDSLMALELRNRLEAVLGITLPAALVWAYPTIAALAEAVCERMGYESLTETHDTDDAFAESSLSDEESDLLADLVEASALEAEMGAANS